MNELELDIKKLIVKALMLESVRPEDIDSDSPLFVEGLGLDSIDALELAIAIEHRFGIKLAASNPSNREIFATVSNLARFVSQHKIAS
jgi:acyl carrier protein